MRKSVHIVILCLTLLLNARCSRPADDIAPQSDVLVNLDIDVALSDISTTRADSNEYAAAVSDHEKMSTLRIVIVREETGEVEANRFIELSPAMEHGIERFKVVGNDTKLIYLFVNELSRIKDDDGILRKVVNYNLANIFPHQTFPTDDLNDLIVSLNCESQQLDPKRMDGGLPMSDCHRITVIGGDDRNAKKDKDGIAIQEENLFVTRAAVKFSFNITNNTLRPITLNSLWIDKMAREEYYLPHNVTRDAQNHITDYEVPSGDLNNGYYKFVADCKVDGEGLVLPIGKVTSLAPIYLLEGKFTDAADARNYSMGLKTVVYGKENEFKKHFPDLSQLPRNTHVVVNITIADDIAWTVDVVPYGSVTLDPIFGIGDPEESETPENPEEPETPAPAE